MDSVNSRLAYQVGLRQLGDNRRTTLVDCPIPGARIAEADTSLFVWYANKVQDAVPDAENANLAQQLHIPSVRMFNEGM
jgi:hypothetical protein